MLKNMKIMAQSNKVKTLFESLINLLGEYYGQSQEEMVHSGQHLPNIEMVLFHCRQFAVNKNISIYEKRSI